MEYLVNFIAEHWFEIVLSIGTVWFGYVFQEWRKKRKVQLEREARELANLHANLKKGDNIQRGIYILQNTIQLAVSCVYETVWCAAWTVIFFVIIRTENTFIIYLVVLNIGLCGVRFFLAKRDLVSAGKNAFVSFYKNKIAEENPVIKEKD